MRILHTESSRHFGGQELRVLMEMEELAAHGVSSVLAARPGTAIVEEASRRGLNVYTVTMRGSVDPVAVGHFLWILQRERIDLVSAHGSKDGWSAGLAARLLGRPVVRCRHVANPIRKHLFGRMVYGWLCDRIVTTSESIREGMAQRGIPAEKIVSVPTGVDRTRFHTGVEKGVFRAELGLSADMRLVGMITVLRGDKGPDVFLGAAERIASERSDIVFVLVGDGWMRGRLEAALESSPHRDRILMTGFRRDIPHIMADLDVLVLSARIPEGVPQTILQAHAMEVPVIASDVGGINEVAIPGETAVGVPPGDPESLADAIVQVLSDPRGAALRAARGKSMVSRHYTREQTVDRMLEIYSSLSRP
ncbi:MAG: glycosyltransferase family 4 protein [Syntrophobacteraceae bacterium]